MPVNHEPVALSSVVGGGDQGPTGHPETRDATLEHLLGLWPAILGKAGHVRLQTPNLGLGT